MVITWRRARRNTTEPPAGARFDISFRASLRGPRLSGTITGIDYLDMRADGRAQLHIHARIATEDGQAIAFFADGVDTPSRGHKRLSTPRERLFSHRIPGLCLAESATRMGSGHRRSGQGPGQSNSVRRLTRRCTRRGLGLNLSPFLAQTLGLGWRPFT